MPCSGGGIVGGLVEGGGGCKLRDGFRLMCPVKNSIKFFVHSSEKLC